MSPLLQSMLDAEVTGDELTDLLVELQDLLCGPFDQTVHIAVTERNCTYVEYPQEIPN